ncbi:hypothetical protein [Halopseudomonas litoralis]|nr:hypothetical protein [Halopseudomonas litoralis]
MNSTAPWLLALLMGSGLLLPSLGQAQEQSMEERLRTQLRMTTQQLQQLQSEQAQMQTASINAEAQRDTALENVKKLEAQLQKAQGQTETLQTQKQAIQAQVRESRQQTGEVQQAYDELLVVARTKEAERAALQASLNKRDTELASCTVKNQQLFEIGKDMLASLEEVSTGSVLQLRQPFAASGRVKFEEMAQVYGDKLYGGQVGARDAADTSAQ